MALVDHQHVDMPYERSLAVHCLDAREDDLATRVAAAKASREDTRRRKRPNAEQFKVILLDQFSDVGSDKDAHVRPAFDQPLDERSHEQRLAASGCKVDQWIARGR